MSDERLRDLERRFTSSQRVEDEAEWLSARIHREELTPERVEVAAVLGHAAARAVLGRPEREPLEIAALAEALRRNPTVATRARVAVGQAALVVWEETCAAIYGPDGAQFATRGRGREAQVRHRLALEATEVWLLSLRDEDARVAAQAGMDASEVGSSFMCASFGGSPEADLHMRSHQAAWIVETAASGLRDPDRLRFDPAEVIVWGGFLADPIARDHRVTPPILAALSPELVPWLLGYDDPVRARVTARRGAR